MSRLGPIVVLVTATLTAITVGFVNAAPGTLVEVVRVHPKTVLGTIHKAVLGVNSDTRYDGAAALRALARTFSSIGIMASRWPGGTHADIFDWRSSGSNTITPYCSSVGRQPLSLDGTFDTYMSALAIPAGVSPELTINYGTSGWPACSGAGDPLLAAAWVSYANVSKHYGIKWWEVGNEVYERGEPDNHPGAHTPESYSTYEPAFYAAMKAADPDINVGIPITAGSHGVPAWDAYVLANAKYDYVVYHYYPTFYPYITDAALLTAPIQGSFAVARVMANIRARLVAAGKCTDACGNYPISVSEWNSVSHNPTPQTFTIVEGLFAAETLGEFFNAGVVRAEFWVDWACQVNTPGRAGYNTRPLAGIYGWQSGVGTQGVTAVSGVPDPDLCPDATFTAPPGTIFPSGRAFQLYAQSDFADEGSKAVSVDAPSPSLRAYASYSPRLHEVVVMLINLDNSNDAMVHLMIDGGTTTGSYRTIQYSKTIYDETRNSGPWNPPVTKWFTSATLPLKLTLPPWSMTTYTFTDFDVRIPADE